MADVPNLLDSPRAAWAKLGPLTRILYSRDLSRPVPSKATGWGAGGLGGSLSAVAESQGS